MVLGCSTTAEENYMASVNDSIPSPTSANIAATSTDKLNDLIETLKDGQLGFAAAAEDARSADIKQVLTKYIRAGNNCCILRSYCFP